MNVMHKHYEKNTQGRDFVIGDLHGCYALLLNGLSAVNFDERVDRLFSVGDLIDRGEQSVECLGLIEADWFHTVLGNHEDMMLDSVLDGASPMRIWYPNGGTWAEEVDADRLRTLAEYVRDNVPVAITVDTDEGAVGICHAEPPTGDWADAVSPGDDLMVRRMLWGRHWITAHQRGGDLREVKGVTKTFHGHTPAKQVIVAGNAHFIDTGSVWTDKLTMFRIQGHE